MTGARGENCRGPLTRQCTWENESWFDVLTLPQVNRPCILGVHVRQLFFKTRVQCLSDIQWHQANT